PSGRRCRTWVRGAPKLRVWHGVGIIMSLPANGCPRSQPRPIGVAAAMVVLGLAALVPVAAAASRAPAILPGFPDHATYQGDAASRAAALDHPRATRARFVRITVGWLTIAPQQPPSDADAADPSWSGYQWSDL